MEHYTRKNHIVQRVTAFFLCLVMVLGSFVVKPPKAKAIAPAIVAIGEWVAANFDTIVSAGSLGYQIWSDLKDNGSDGYNSYVSQLQRDLGATTFGTTGFNLSIPVTSVTLNDVAVGGAAGNAIAITANMYNKSLKVSLGDVTAPIAGKYYLMFPNYGGSAYLVLTPGFNNNARNGVTAGTALTTSASVSYSSYESSDGWISGNYYYQYIADDFDLNTYTAAYGGVSGRAGVLAGTYISSGGTTYENTTIVNEGAKTFYNPTTGTTTAYDHFTYDYATRTYTLYDAAGNVIAVITYGDDQLKISQGGTDTGLNYAVPSGSGGEDPGESGSGTSLLDKIKDGVLGVLATLIEGLFDLIKTILKKLIGLMIDLLSFVFDFLSVKVVGGITNLFSSFGDSSITGGFTGSGSGSSSSGTGYALPEGVPAAFTFISGMFGVLPDPIRYVFLFGIAGLFLLAVFRKVRE